MLLKNKQKKNWKALAFNRRELKYFCNATCGVFPGKWWEL